MTAYPAIVLNVVAPAQATEATTIAVSVTGLEAGEVYTIGIGTAVLASGTAPGGTLTASVGLGSTSRGAHTVVATGQSPDRTGSAPITVNPSGSGTKRKG